MNILIFGRDPTLFESGSQVTQDTRKRHQLYAKVLREHCGVDSTIRVICYTPVDAKYQVQQLEDGLTLYPTRSPHRATFLLGAIQLLPQVLRDWRPDLITVQTPWEEGTLGYWLSRLLGAKFLPQLHVDIFSEGWRQEHWLNGWRRWVASQLIRHADGVRVVSEVLKNKVIEHLQTPSNQVFVVPVGVNFSPVNSLSGKDLYKEKINLRLVGKPVVLFVGRFCDQKNLFLWVEVAQRVIDQLPDAQFIMAGNGSLFTKIRSLTEAKRLQDNFYFLGKVGYEKLPDVYAAADIFLLTSNYEGYGRVIVESMLAEVPVVSTACTGPEDLIIHGVNGFLLPVKDLCGLSNAVLSLLTDAQKAQQMGRAGKIYIQHNFSTQALIDKLIACWALVGKDICRYQREDAESESAAI